MGCLLAEMSFDRAESVAMNRKPMILVVDDQPFVRSFIANALQPDYETLLASDGLEAMKYYESHSDCIACVITDLIMPHLTGDRLLDWLRQRNSSLPVILMTGGAGTINLDRLLKQPQVALLRKPFTLAELDNAVRTPLL